MTISLIQMSINLGKIESNLEKVQRMLLSAADADIVVLPELWSCGYDYSRLKRHAETTPELLNKLSSLAKENVMHIVAGSMPELQEDKIYNTSYIIDHHGNIQGHYRKIHLFPNIKEEQHFDAGDMLLPVETVLGKIGVMLCFDLRFPELARMYSSYETKLVIVPAQWPVERIEHWRLLLRARALENQIFLVGVNCVGRSKFLSGGGNSLVVDPNGIILAESGNREKVITTDIELGQVNLIRNDFRVWRSRRRKLYHINFCFPLQDEQSDPQSE